MARNADDTLSSFGVSPTIAAPELDFSAMITSLENHRDPVQVFQGFNLDDEAEVLYSELLPVDTMDIFELFHNDGESATDLKFSQAFGTFEKESTDSGFYSGPFRAPKSLNDTITQIVDEIELPENQQNINLSPSWFCDSEMVPIATASGRQSITWDSNGQRSPSPDIFADCNSDIEESMKPYQICNTNKLILTNVKGYTSASENMVENYTLHTIGPKEINNQSVKEFNWKSNSCVENNSAEENIIIEQTPDPIVPTYSATDKTPGFGTIIFDNSSKESVSTLEAQILPQNLPSHAPSQPIASKPFVEAIVYDNCFKKSFITLEDQNLPQKLPSHVPSQSIAARPFVEAIVYDSTYKRSDFVLQVPILSQQSSSPATAQPAAANSVIGDIGNDIACKETVVTIESSILTHQPHSIAPAKSTPAKSTPANPFSGDIFYDVASKNSVVSIETPLPSLANTLIDKIISNSEEVAITEPTNANIRTNLCQAVVVEKSPLPTGSVSQDLAHSTSTELINIPEKSTSCPIIFNADCLAESSNHREDHIIPMMNDASNFETLTRNADLTRDVFQNDCPAIDQSVFAHEICPDYKTFKRPFEIIHEPMNMDIDMNLETDLNEVDMDETFSRTFEESQLQTAMAGQLPHLLNEVPRIAESNTKNVSIDAGINLEHERTHETVHNEIDMDDTFCRTFEESQFNQAFSSQLPYLFKEMHRYAETVTKNVPAYEEVNSYTIEQLLPTQSELSAFDYSAAQPIKNTQNAKDFSECFPGGLPMKRINLPDPTGQALQDFHIAKIELIILQVLDDLINQKQIEFVVLKRKSMANCCFDVDSQTLRMMDGDKAEKSRIFGKNRIALLLSMLAEVYRALKTRITCTKRFDVNSYMVIVQCRHANQRDFRRKINRELYYSEPELTQSQQNVDTTIKDICCILEAKPWDLGVFSSSKGLLAGNIKLTLHDDDIIDCNAIAGGITLPHFTTGIKLIETDAKFVLLVEKDTVFEKLIQQDVLQKFEGHCIMVTGRGYPDTNTRVFLKKLWDQHHLPIYALFDADPYGIEIMLIYRFGSIAMSYTVDDLAVPAIQWIGVYPSDIKKLALPSMSMQLRDFTRLKDLIKRSYISESIFSELLILQTDGRKTEIEALYSNNTPLFLIDTYLARRVKVSI